MRATSMREGAFSRRLMVGCEQSARPLSGARPEASLNMGSARSASQSSASSHGSGFAGPRTGSAAGDREHAEAQHGGKRVDDQRLLAPIPDTACQRLGQTETVFRLAQQDEAAVGGDQAAIEGGDHLLALDGWQVEGKKAIVGHGGRGAFVVREEGRVDNGFLPDGNGLRHVRYLRIRPAVNNPGYIDATAMCQAAGKLWGHYWETATAKNFATELSLDIGIPISNLVQVFRGKPADQQGTWVHPQVAIHLGQWLSPKFAVRVTSIVLDWMAGLQRHQAFERLLLPEPSKAELEADVSVKATPDGLRDAVMWSVVVNESDDA